MVKKSLEKKKKRAGRPTLYGASDELLRIRLPKAALEWYRQRAHAEGRSLAMQVRADLVQFAQAIRPL